MMTPRIAKLVASMLSGDKKSLAKLISLVENDSSAFPEILDMLLPHLSKAHCIGITGPPGSGKSTLVDKLVTKIRSQGMAVGIIAVDPSSSISGGAVLGDRVRMQRHYLDDSVFIRSMATRGSRSGLSDAVQATANLLDAFGKDVIIIETVGVGQIEVSIAEVADIVVLVLVPESGDGIQCIKAGVVEIADIIVVNKADREGAERLANELRAVVTSAHKKLQPSVIITQAINNIGIEELYQEIEKRCKSC